jgi:prophage tail gpP-like protein
MELVINDRIRNRKIEFFNSFNISLKYNSLASTFSFDFYYDPDVDEQKQMACVGHYHLCQLFHEGELILTGQILSEAFADSQTKSLVPISGYALPGILEDCQVPVNKAIDLAIASGNLKLPKTSPAIPYAYPIQDESLTLRQIVTKYIAPFPHLKFVVDPAVDALMDEQITETAIEPKDTIKHYINELASQKNINLTHNEKGEIFFTRVKTNLKPVLRFNVPKGGLPGTKMKLMFNGQQMHSHITVMKQADIDDVNAGEETVVNPYVPFVFRPKTIIQSAGTNTDTLLAAKNARAAELRELTLTVEIDRWQINNKMIKPNNLITVTNPEIYIFKPTNFFIESIDYKGNEKELTAILHCVLPSCYDGSEPDYIYKGINIH